MSEPKISINQQFLHKIYGLICYSLHWTMTFSLKISLKQSYGQSDPLLGVVGKHGRSKREMSKMCIKLNVPPLLSKQVTESKIIDQDTWKLIRVEGIFQKPVDSIVSQVKEQLKLKDKKTSWFHLFGRWLRSKCCSLKKRN